MSELPFKVLVPQLVDSSRLNPAPYNPSKVDRKHIEQVKTSIIEENFLEPLVAQKDSLILIGGHTRLVAVKEICFQAGVPLPELPVYILDISNRHAKLLNIKLNNLKGSFDDKLLGALLKDIESEEKMRNEEITGIGLDDDKVLRLINKSEPKPPKVEDPTDAFGKSVTVSLKFTDIEQRDRVKRHIDARCKRENKESGALIAEILGILCLCFRASSCAFMRSATVSSMKGPNPQSVLPPPLNTSP